MSDSTYFNPFPGLRSFEEEEEYLFFGRENQIDELLSKLNKTRLLAVVGASGSGKSSLVKSGLIPALHSGYLSNAGSGWRICTLKPGNDPIGNLSEALSSEEILGENQVTPNTSAIIESILRRSSKGIAETIRQLSDSKDQNILIVVDQFEELFRFSKYEKSVSKGTRDAVVFINLLLEISARTQGRIYIVFTMRSDFLGDCSEFRGLPEAINDGQYLIPRMTREERKAAITGPIAVGGAQISQSLLARLLNDVGDNPDQLPILQHALMRTWDYWTKTSSPDSPIDLIHYEAIGTMSKALSLHAEEAFAEINDDEGRIICEKLFRFLTEKRNDGRGVRHPGLVSDICELTGASLEKLTQIIDIFRKPGRSFLMPPFGLEIHEDTIIDISHESLMRVWERLQTWVQEEIESAELYIRLGQSAELYQEGKTGLWRDPELMMATNWKASQKPNAIWAKRYYPSFDRAMNYLEHSISEKEREIKAEELKRKAAILRLRIFIGIISIACIGAIFLGIKAKLSANEAVAAKILADSSAAEALRQKDIATENEEQARLFANEAVAAKILADSSAAEALRQKDIATQNEERARLSEIAAIAAKNSADSSAKVALTQKQIADANADSARRSEIKALNAQRESNRLRMLAEANNLAIKSQQIIQDPLKDTTSLQLAFLSYGLNKFLEGPPDNRIIYDALKDQLTKSYIESYQVRNDKKNNQSRYDERSAVFADNENFYTTGDDGIIKHWKLEGSPTRIVEFEQSSKVDENFSKLLLSPDKSLLLATSVNGSLYLFETSNISKLPVPVQNADTPITFAAFVGYDLNTVDLLVGYSDRAVVNRIEKSTLLPTEIQTFGDQDFGNVGQFSSFINGNEIGVFLTGQDFLKFLKIEKSQNNYNYSELVDIPIPREFTEIISFIGSSKSGKYMALGGDKGRVALFSFTGSRYTYQRNVPGNISSITGIVFSNDDSQQTIITSAFDHTIHINRFSDSKNEGLILKESPLWVRGLALSDDNKNIIATGQGGFITVWPSNIENLVASLNKIEDIQQMLNSEVNTVKIKDEIGEDLYESIEVVDAENEGMSKFWQFLTKEYLKN
ncbi:hypothetical protein AAGF08_05880 [Algoriphagus sp. SE2]|uniref:nSTAND1 domain-containing NTPase n=1 Tax=Algoriphagus sp. SE2 TaxID=3141536 RepID=UPI0031CD5DCE